MRYSHYLKSIYVLIFLIFLIPRTIGLGSDIANYDSSYWYPRMQNFTKYLLRGEYKETYQKYHPGVTLMWISGTSEYIFEQTFEAVLHFNPRYIPQQFTRLHFATKFPLVVIISFLGTLQFFYIKRLYDTKLAAIFAIMLSFEPFFLGVSRFLHLSALTSMFMFTSFLMLYYSLKQKTSNSKKLFYLSAVILGLGMLTKIDALIVAPVNTILIIFYGFTDQLPRLESHGMLFSHVREANASRVHLRFKDRGITLENKQKIKKLIIEPIIYFLLVFVTFYSLFPTMWVAPFSTIQQMYKDGILDTAFNSNGTDTFTNIKELFYIETIFLRSLPTTVIALLGAIYLYIKSVKSRNSKPLISWVTFYIIFNLVILTIPDKIKDRYLINLYPPLLLLASTWVYKITELKNKFVKFGIIGILSLCYLLTIYRYHPVYSFYYTDFIAGPAGIEKLGLKVKNRGEFYAQAASYINKTDDHPEVRNVVISSRERTKTFAPFFYGETFSNPKFMKDNYFADYIISEEEYDYLVPKENCSIIKAFGPKDPFEYDMLKLYSCKGLTNDYKDFKN